MFDQSFYKRYPDTRTMHPLAYQEYCRMLKRVELERIKDAEKLRFARLEMEQKKNAKS